jgi:hypothetical protein
MAKIPLPQRGQPLDLNYIYQLATVVNDVASKVSSSNQNTSYIDTAASGSKNIRTADSRIVGGYISVQNSSTTSPDGEGAFSYTFDSDFAYVPIVTATPILIEDGSTESGKDISVVLTKVTTNRVEGVVRFNTIGVASVGINLLVFGIPV